MGEVGCGGLEVGGVVWCVEVWAGGVSRRGGGVWRGRRLVDVL